MAAVALVGTLDTKGADFAFLAARLRAAGAEVIVVDAGTGEPDGLSPDIDGATVAAAAGTSLAELRCPASRGTRRARSSAGSGTREDRRVRPGRALRARLGRPLPAGARRCPR